MDHTPVDWVNALGQSEVYVCLTDASGRRTLTTGPIERWLEQDPNLLDGDAPFDRDGRSWEATATRQRSGAVMHVVKPSTHHAAIHNEQSRILQPLIESAPVAILTLDLQMRVTMWNPACERIFGWTAAEVIGQPYPLVPPEEWDQFQEFFQSVVDGRGFNGIEARRRHSDGSPVYIAISTAPVRSDDGDVIGAMAILEDITQRKHLEEQYRQATKLEAIGRLAGGIAHDFNNLLTVILGYSDGLEEVESKGELREAADAIQLAADRAAALTQQLLAFSRKQVMKTEIIDLSEVVRQTMKMTARLIRSNIEVLIELDEQPVWVDADPVQIEQALINLVTNACDAMPQGGKLHLETSRIEIVEQPWAQLVVTDTGEGIDAETAAHIFDPFFTTKEVGKGTGLGLASVHGVARQSGGDVTVKSSPGAGATFCMQLPLLDTPPDEADTATASEDRKQIANILLAEDNDDVRRILTRMLRVVGHRVTAATNGKEALELAQQSPDDIDLLITDVVMPGINGGELAKRIRERIPAIKVLFVSGYADDEGLRRNAPDGAQILQKPFTLNGIRAAIAKLLATP